MGYDVSVIIPVHNGSKIIKKTVKRLLNQKNCSFEIILIENFSDDGSAQICDQLMNDDDRIKTFHCFERGTSMARKLGVEIASGEYIVFSDQDDYFISDYALAEEVDLCRKKQVDICQFGHYTEYAPGFRKKKSFNLSADFVSFDRNELLHEQIKGVLGFGWSESIYLRSSVWDKCYRAKIVKEAVESIDHEALYFNEDRFLNTYCFFNENVKSVGVCNNAYYVWITGGYSSTPQSVFAFIKDLEHSKKAAIKMITKFTDDINLQNECYLDTLTIYYWTAFSLIDNKTNKEDIISWIEETEQLQCIIEAKKHLRDCRYRFENDSDRMIFITSDYSAEEYFTWCLTHLPAKTIKGRIRKYAGKTITAARKRILGY